MIEEFLKTKEIKKIESIEDNNYYYNKSKQTRLERELNHICYETKDGIIRGNIAVTNCELKQNALQIINEYKFGNKEILEKLAQKYKIVKCDYFISKGGYRVLRYCFNGKRMSESRVKEHLKMDK